MPLSYNYLFIKLLNSIINSILLPLFRKVKRLKYILFILRLLILEPFMPLTIIPSLLISISINIIILLVLKKLI